MRPLHIACTCRCERLAIDENRGRDLPDRIELSHDRGACRDWRRPAGRAASRSTFARLHRTQADQEKFPQTAVFEHIEAADGRLYLRPSGIPEFAGDLPESEQALVWAT